MFTFRLCMVLGVPHPKYLPLTAEEYLDWEAFFTIEPWGFDVENARNAQLAATVANFSGNTRTRLKPSDFMPPQPEELEPSLDDKIKAAFRGQSF